MCAYNSSAKQGIVIDRDAFNGYVAMSNVYYIRFTSRIQN